MSWQALRTLFRGVLRPMVADNLIWMQNVEKIATLSGCTKRFLSTDDSDTAGWDHNNEKKPLRPGEVFGTWQ